MANLHQEIDRGGKAERLMADPLYREAVDSARKAVHEKWANSPLSDTDGQVKLRMLLKALDEIEGYIKEVAKTGKLAALQLEQEKQHKSAVRRTLEHMGIRT